MSSCRRLALLGALLFSVSPLRAQTSFDVYAGGNSATQQSSQRETEPLSGFVAGLSALRHVTSWFALEGGALYSEKGSQSLSHRYRLSYLEIPLTIRLSTKQPVFRVQPYAVAGVASAQRVGCSGWNIVTPPGGTGPRPMSMECNQFSNTDFGKLFGAGASYTRTHVQYRAEVRKTVGRDIAVDPAYTLRNDVTSFFLIAQFKLR
jgi:hypothetical protein